MSDNDNTLPTNDPENASGILPDVIPIFPLSNALLLPCAKMPLNIFEPRYIDMVDYCMGHDRLIGMVQPRVEGEEQQESRPEIYAMGCLGRVVSFNESGDGRYGITLLGVSRFTITQEQPSDYSFRLVRADYETFVEDLNETTIQPQQRIALLKTVKAYLSAHGIDAQWSTIDDAADYALITSLSMLCPFTASEKQALLECDTIDDRSILLDKLMSLSLHKSKPGKPTTLH